MTVYYRWDDDPSDITITLDLSDRDFSTTDDGHICSGYGRHITSLPYRLSRSLG